MKRCQKLLNKTPSFEGNHCGKVIKWRKCFLCFCFLVCMSVRLWTSYTSQHFSVFQTFGFWPFYGLFSGIFRRVRIFSVCIQAIWPRNPIFWKCDLKDHIPRLFPVFKNCDFLPFDRFRALFYIFGRFSGIFFLWTSYRSHPMTQEPISLKIWSQALYPHTLFSVFQNFNFWPFYSLFG